MIAARPFPSNRSFAAEAFVTVRASITTITTIKG